MSGLTGKKLAGLGILGISLAFGLAVVAMDYALDQCSGCHINPAISIAILASGKQGNPNMAGFAIGIPLVLIHLVAISITGTSVNPLRSIGLAIFAGVNLYLNYGFL